jgi:hypothetical protein
VAWSGDGLDGKKMEEGGRISMVHVLRGTSRSERVNCKSVVGDAVFQFKHK